MNTHRESNYRYDLIAQGEHQQQEEKLLDYLNQNESISFNQFYKMTVQTRNQAGNALAKLIHIGLIEAFYTSHDFFTA